MQVESLVETLVDTLVEAGDDDYVNYVDVSPQLEQDTNATNHVVNALTVVSDKVVEG